MAQVNDVDTYLRELTRAGWSLERTGKHRVLRSPDGKSLVVSQTASDRRAMLNIRTQVRRLERGVPLSAGQEVK